MITGKIVVQVHTGSQKQRMKTYKCSIDSTSYLPRKNVLFLRLMGFQVIEYPECYLIPAQEKEITIYSLDELVLIQKKIDKPLIINGDFLHIDTK